MGRFTDFGHISSSPPHLVPFVKTISTSAFPWPSHCGFLCSINVYVCVCVRVYVCVHVCACVYVRVYAPCALYKEVSFSLNTCVDAATLSLVLITRKV